MRLDEIVQTPFEKMVVIAGGFHPFHSGHMDLYQRSVRAFPDATVYVASSDVRSERPFPFPIKKKLATIAGVPSKNFIKVERPFNQEEYLPYANNPNKTALIFVRSEKDAGDYPKAGDPASTVKQGPRKGLPPYILSYEDFAENLQPMTKHAYITYMPTVSFGKKQWTSASEIRAAWVNANDDQKNVIVKTLYPNASADKLQTARDLLTKVLG